MRRFVASNSIEEHLQETILIYETYRNGERIERIETRSLVGVTSREMCHSLLQDAGFHVQREFCDYQFSLFHPGDDLLIIEAVKS